MDMHGHDIACGLVQLLDVHSAAVGNNMPNLRSRCIFPIVDFYTVSGKVFLEKIHLQNSQPNGSL